MALINVGTLASNGDTANATDISTPINIIVNDYNGNIDNTNIKASAAIVDTKLAQITTASKVSGTALTGLASIPSGAGVIPTANIPTVTTTFVGTFTRDMDAATADVAYTGVGFKPKAVVFLAGGPAVFEMSTGFSDGTTNGCVFNNGGITDNRYEPAAAIITLVEATGKSQSGVIKTLDTDGFTITWTRTGATAGGAASIYYLAIG